MCLLTCLQIQPHLYVLVNSFEPTDWHGAPPSCWITKEMQFRVHYVSLISLLIFEMKMTTCAGIQHWGWWKKIEAERVELADFYSNSATFSEWPYANHLTFMHIGFPYVKCVSLDISRLLWPNVLIRTRSVKALSNLNWLWLQFRIEGTSSPLAFRCHIAKTRLFKLRKEWNNLNRAKAQVQHTGQSGDKNVVIINTMQDLK